MKIVGIIQARMSSSRLPGKMLLEAVGKSLIILMLERVSGCRLLDELWLATSEERSDDPLAKEVERAGYPVFRGSLDHVLSRYWHIGKQAGADAVVRLTGDCPLHDPVVIDSVVDFFLRNREKVDYVSNVRPPTYPDGLDTEVFSFSALERAYRNASTSFEIEHVVPYIFRSAVESGRQGNVPGPADFSHLRWTVDEKEDYDLIRSVFEELYPVNDLFGWMDVVAWQTRNPRRLEINSMHSRNAGSAESVSGGKL